MNSFRLSFRKSQIVRCSGKFPADSTRKATSSTSFFAIFLVEKDREEAGRGRGLSGAVGGKLSGTSDDLRFSKRQSERVHRPVQAGGSDSKVERVGEVGADRDRWDEV